MGIELLGSRLLAPGLGTSVLIWTNLIGVILLSLALGAWLGGVLADRWPEPRLLGACLGLAGCLTFGLFFLTRFSMSRIFFSHEALAAPFLSLIFLAPPCLVLGAVSPMAVRLALHETQSAGHIAGQLSALNTLGSLLGTYLTGYVLIAHWPTHLIIPFLASWLILLGLILLRWPMLIRLSSAVAVAALFCLGAVVPALPGTWVPSHYSAIRVTRQFFHQDMSRLLWMNNDVHAGASLAALNTSVFAYDRVFVRLAKTLQPNATNLLQIGGGAFHSPREWLSDHPTGQATVIERDPAVIQTAHTYFALQPSTRLQVIADDGRQALRKLASTYDLVFIDAYADRLTIPWHLLTVEAWRDLNTHLKPDGLVMLNVIINRDPKQRSSQALIASIVNATGARFDWSRLILADDRSFPPGPLVNAILILGRGQAPGDQRLLHAATIDPWIASAVYPIDQTAHAALTDAFAPVEWLSAQLL